MALHATDGSKGVQKGNLSEATPGGDLQSHPIIDTDGDDTSIRQEYHPSSGTCVPTVADPLRSKIKSDTVCNCGKSHVRICVKLHVV